MKKKLGFLVLAMVLVLCMALIGCPTDGGNITDTGWDWTVHTEGDASEIAIDDSIDGTLVVSGNVDEDGSVVWKVTPSAEALALLQTEAESISFTVVGDGKTYTLRLPTSDATGTHYYEITFETVQGMEQTVTIKISKLVQADGGETTPFDKANVQGIEFAPADDVTGEFSLTITDLKLLDAANKVIVESKSGEGSGEGDGGSEPASLEGVYIAGVYRTGTTGATSIPAYWKDGVRHELGEEGDGNATHAITFVGSDLYITGWYDGNACYWKNGERIDIASSYSWSLNDIAVVGNDIHVIGGSSYWKNGERIYLSPAAANPPDPKRYAVSVSNDIAVTGSDVYIAGYYYYENNPPLAGASPTYYACYWKNGVKTDLSPGTSASTYDIAVAGSTVYVAGRRAGSGRAYLPCYWKNGATPTNLSIPTVFDGTIVNNGQTMIKISEGEYQLIGYDNGETWLGGSARAVAVVGSDVYIAGTVDLWYRVGGSTYGVYSSTACYWKNGVRTDLTKGGLTASDGVNDIAVVGSDVYILGSDDGKRCYWKNGVKTELGSDVYAANAIFVYSENSSSGGGTQTGTAPTTPTGLKATGSSSSTIDLNWNTVSGATGYYIYRSTSSTGTYEKTGSVKEPPIYNYGLPANATYYYKVSAYNSSGESALSVYAGGTTLTADIIGGSDPEAGTLTISGCPYTTSNANVTVRAISGNVIDVNTYLKNQAIFAAGSGIIASSNTVTWTGTKVPNGACTIVMDTLIGGNLRFYKASGVSLNKGSGKVSWSSFSEFK